MRVAAVLLVALGAGAARGQWYNGDPDLVSGLSAEFDTIVSDSFVFEDFDHPGGTISEVFGNFWFSTLVRGFRFEIRSGVSNGFGGTLHASGDTDGPFSWEPNGFDGFGFEGQTFTADIEDVSLGPGTYMLALSLVGNGTGRAFVQMTDGTNGYGSPTGNGLNWFHSNYFGHTYAENYYGPDEDYSYGVRVVPSPAGIALVVLSGVTGGRRR